jgi:hypothetical protein
MQSSSKVTSLDKSGLALVLISSVLLGIWATMNTIALRNVLLWVGAIIALAYWWNWFKVNKVNQTLPSLSGLYWLAVSLIAFMLIWVVIHYFLFAQNPQQQLSELRSTWLRSLLAVILGSATGLALNRSSRFMPWLWLGLLLSFVVLIYQYIPKAIAKQSLFAVDWFGDYIYWAKFNGVLAGTILIAGLLGLLIDSVWQNKNKDKTMQLGMTADQEAASHSNGVVVRVDRFSRIAVPFYVFFGICIAAYSFVFIFDAKAGVGMSFILIVFWLGIGLLFILKNAASEQDKKLRRVFLTKSLITFFLVVVGLSWFAAKHIKNNPGWGSLFEDIAIGTQIDNYPNWREIGGGINLPLREDGTAVASNTYERVALGTLGMHLITVNPIGNGSLRSLKEDATKIEPNYKNHPYTHSAWIDLGLSFGLPGLLFLPVALFSLLLCAVLSSRMRFRATIITVAIAILILYLVGEYAFQHGVEILFYLSGLLCGLALVNYATLRPRQS